MDRGSRIAKILDVSRVPALEPLPGIWEHEYGPGVTSGPWRGQPREGVVVEKPTLALTELKAVCPLCGAPIDKPHGIAPGDLLEPRAARCLVCPWTGTALFMVQPEIRG